MDFNWVDHGERLRWYSEGNVWTAEVFKADNSAHVYGTRRGVDLEIEVDVPAGSDAKQAVEELIRLLIA